MLKPLRAFAVENSVSVGCPDICCLSGWIEMKVGAAPRPGVVVRVGLRQTQRAWLRGWRMGGGRALTLCVLGESWLLSDGLWSADRLDHATIEEAIDNAVRYWEHKPSSDDLVRSLLSWDHRRNT